MALMALAAAQTIVWAGLFYLFPILLLRWEADFGWSRAEIALALTLSLIVSAIASPLIGGVIDRGRSRIAMPLSAAFGGALLFVLSMVETQEAFFLIWALIGLAMAGCLYEPCFAFLTRVRGASARPAITMVTLIAGFASSIAFPLADILTDAYGWRVAAQVFAGAILLGAVPAFWFSILWLEARAAAPAAPAGAQKEAARRALKQRQFWFLAAAFPLMGLTHGMIISNIIPILRDCGASQGLAVFAASLIGPMQVAGRVAITLGGRRRSAVALTLVSFAGVAASIAVLLIAVGFDGRIFVFVSLLGASYGVMSITKPEVTADLLGRDGFGAISGMLATPYIACAAAAPTVAVFLWGIAGYELTLGVGAVAVAAAALLLHLAAR